MEKNKGEELAQYIAEHVLHPCGKSEEAQDYMQGVHLDQVRQALENHGVRKEFKAALDRRSARPE